MEENATEEDEVRELDLLLVAQFLVGEWRAESRELGERVGESC